jgi:GntR family transcriptional regulator / MocR family aminotransferase
MMELTPDLDANKPMPLYMQLYDYIKNKILQGHIRKGTTLPSIRVLSKHLGISRNTVESAYGQLIAEGYVESKPRVGLIVKELDEELQPNLRQLKTYEIIANEQYVDKPKYDFRYGNIDTANFPMKVWRKCMNEALDAELEQILWYGERQGDIELRQQIAHYLFQARGIHCSYKQIVINSGIHQMTGLLCQLFSQQKDIIAMENPSYDGIRSVFMNHHYQIIPISLKEDGLNVDELEKSNANMVYVTPSHQLPLGMVLPIGKRQKLLRWAAKKNAFIIEDDYDSEFRYENKPIPALKALDTQDRVIYLGTFSKVLTPAIRVSYMVLPHQLVEVFQKKFHNYNQPVATMIQKALAIFMKQGHLERHIRKMRNIYAKKQQTLITAIRENFGDSATIIGEKAGLHLLIQLNNDYDVDDLVKKAENAGIKVYSAAKYWFGDVSSPPPYILLGFGGMSEFDIMEGIRLLKKVWGI